GHHGREEDVGPDPALPSVAVEQGRRRHPARRGPPRTRRPRRGALRRTDRGRDGGVDGARRRLPHRLRHGEGDRPRHDPGSHSSRREARRQVGRMAREGAQRMSGMITVEEALKRVLASAETPLGEERAPLDAAYGRVLARDLVALRTQPPFPNSAMDGYALRAADASALPATLTVIGESAAGRAFSGAVGPGQAARIFTGAPMPEGAD